MAKSSISKEKKMNNMVKCHCCNNEYDGFDVEFRDIIVDGSYKPICITCYTEKFFICSHCESTFSDETKITHNEQILCERCYNELYFTCSSCNEIFSRNQAMRTGRNHDIYMCRECYSQGEIQSNGYKPEPKFKKLPDEKHERYMGLELEVDSGENAHSLSKDIYKIVNKDSYNKYDGSLRCGLEIVTHPFTLEYHKQKYPWNDVLQTCINHKFKSHQTESCGLHIHLNRRAFGRSSSEIDSNVMKLILFFENNWNEMVIFSRRKENALNSWAKRHSFNPMANEEVWKMNLERAKGHGNRYMAVNLCPRNTIEIRIFRGTLVKQTLFAALELLDLLMIRLPQLSFTETQQYKFNKVIEDAEEMGYDNLAHYIKERDIVGKSSLFLEKIKKLKVGDKVYISGRVVGLPERSSFWQNMEGHIVEMRDNMVKVRLEPGEYWFDPMVVCLCSEREVSQTEE
jgi:hypothetical protein